MSWIHDRIYVRNQSCNILICGAVGTGKSFTALRIAELLQPDFDVKKQVVYTKEEFNALINEYKDNPESSGFHTPEEWKDLLEYIGYRKCEKCGNVDYPHNEESPYYCQDCETEEEEVTNS